jgi:hypothetical protein
MKPEPTLTVAQLIERLSHLDPSLPVEAEGCDCVNRVTGIEVGNKSYYGHEYLLLTVDVHPLVFYGEEYA